MTQHFRLDNVGLINRDKKLSFKFNGKKYFGNEGDTLASALLANGVHLIGRSFKYHRPRGFFGAGVDEPYAIVQLYRNGETEPNIKATEQELFEGLEATSVNCWPSVNFDIGAINNFLKIFLPAGFYYKTFMWPKSFWYKVYEPFIRKAAGLGVASTKHDKEISDQDWDNFVYNRKSLRGKHWELWQHISGCRQWIKVERDTATHEIFNSLKANEEIS